MKNNCKSFLLMGAFAMFLTNCGARTPAEPLSKVEGFSYTDGVLYYEEVEGAAEYEVTFKHKGEVVFNDKVNGTAIDVESLDLGGLITLEIVAVNGARRSEVATYTFTVMKTFDEVIIEAEDNLYNFGTGKEQSNFRNNPLAHKGAYVGGLDDAGHGIYINYLSPVEGTFEFQSYYCFHQTTGMTEAHHDVVVNGDLAHKTGFRYTVDTGWGGDTFNPSMASTNITLRKGWNTIAVYKNGDSSNNWGDFAEIDYVKIVGDGSQYDPDDLDEYGVRPGVYKLEAEMGSPRKKGGSGMTECKNPCIAGSSYSNGFLMGGVENKYDGVEWHFDSPVKANYEISISYASGQFDGSQKARPTFIVTEKQILLQKNIDFGDYEQQQMDALDYTGWNNPTVAEQKFTLELNQGDNFIYCLLMDGSGFFQIDYCDLVFVEEVE